MLFSRIPASSFLTFVTPSSFLGSPFQPAYTVRRFADMLDNGTVKEPTVPLFPVLLVSFILLEHGT